MVSFDVSGKIGFNQGRIFLDNLLCPKFFDSTGGEQKINNRRIGKKYE